MLYLTIVAAFVTANIIISLMNYGLEWYRYRQAKQIYGSLLDKFLSMVDKDESEEKETEKTNLH